MKITLISTIALAAGASFFSLPESKQLRAQIEKAHFETVKDINSFSESIFNSLSEEEIKSWLNYHKLEAEGTYDELVHTAQQNIHLFSQDLGEYVKELGDKSTPYVEKGQEFYEHTAKVLNDKFTEISNAWSENSLYDFLEARGIHVPHNTPRNKLVELVNQAKNQVANLNPTAKKPHYWFSSLSRKELVQALEQFGRNVEGTRDELVARLQDAYNTASESFEKSKAEGSEKSHELLNSFGKWREETFQHWTTEDIKEYLESYGQHVGNTKDELVAKARENYRYFVYGEVAPKTFVDQVSDHLQAVYDIAYSHISNLLGLGSKIEV